MNKSIVENLISAGAFPRPLCPQLLQTPRGAPDLHSAAQRTLTDVNQCSLFECLPSPEDEAGPDLPDVEGRPGKLELEKEPSRGSPRPGTPSISMRRGPFPFELPHCRAGDPEEQKDPPSSAA
ncbi:hypothetical protein MASR2M17_02260 [Aminivibrio sp.]